MHHKLGIIAFRTVFDLLGLQVLEAVALAKAQGVKDSSWVPKLGVGDLVALEDGVLVDAAVLLDVLPAADLRNR